MIDNNKDIMPPIIEEIYYNMEPIIKEYDVIAYVTCILTKKGIWGLNHLSNQYISDKYMADTEDQILINILEDYIKKLKGEI